ELPPSLPYFFALGDVGDKDRHLDDIAHAAAGRLEEMANLAEDLLRLGIFVAAGAGASRGHTGDIGDAVGDQAVRPGAGSGLGDLGSGSASDAAHRFASCCGEPSLTFCESGFHRPRPTPAV